MSRLTSTREEWGPHVKWVPLVVAAIAIVGLLLRLPSFGDSLFADELSTYYVVTGHGLGTVLHLVNGHAVELNPPGYFVLAWISEKLFGNSTQSLKLVALAAGTATIPLTYLLGRWTVGARAGIVASALAALCPFLIFYSTEARPYALLMLLTLLSTLALLSALRTGERGWWLAYAAFSCAAAYTHYTSVFLLVGQLAWALISQPRARRALLTANAAAAIGFLPWLPRLIAAERSPGTKVYAGLEPFTLHAIRVDLGRWAIGHPYVMIARVPGSLAAIIALVGVAVGVIGVLVDTSSLQLGTRLGEVADLRLRRPDGHGSILQLTPAAVLVIVLACADPIGIALYSSVRESLWGSRQLISSWPAFAVLVAALLTYAPGPWRIAASALVIAAFTIGGAKMLEASNQRPDYKAVAAYIAHTDSEGGPAVDYPSPTPGPPTELEAALSLEGSARRHPVVRLGAAPLKAVLSASPFASLSPQPGEVVAREAAALAGNGFLFFVAPISATIGGLERLRQAHVHGGTTGLAALASFFEALPARFHPVKFHTYPGLTPVTVYAFKG